MLAEMFRSNPLTSVYRERLLPSPGKILVRKGQRVKATDIVAETDIEPRYLMIDIGRGLGLTAERADNHLQCDVGNFVSEGDILAGPVGFSKRIVRAPKTGQVVLKGDGKLILKISTDTYQLKAGVTGTVKELVNDRGIIITTTGAVVQGVWGNDQIDSGQLYVLNKQPYDVLLPDALDVSLRGMIVLGGHCHNKEVFTIASKLTIRGLILSSVTVEILSIAEQVSLPVIVIEGFGKQPLNNITHKLLITNEGRDVTVNAQRWDRFRGSRPEVIISLPDTGILPVRQDSHIYEIGQTVRCIRRPYQGKIGKLINLQKETTQLKNGIKAQVGNVRMESGEIVIIPLANLEVIV